MLSSEGSTGSHNVQWKSNSYVLLSPFLEFRSSYKHCFVQFVCCLDGQDCLCVRQTGDQGGGQLAHASEEGESASPVLL